MYVQGKYVVSHTYTRDDPLLLHVLGHSSHHGVRLARPRLTVGKDTDVVPTHVPINTIWPEAIVTLN